MKGGWGLGERLNQKYVRDGRINILFYYNSHKRLPGNVEGRGRNVEGRGLFENLAEIGGG
jgi:hypothetical protein